MTEQVSDGFVLRAEAARQLKVSKSTVVRLAEAGLLEEIRPSPLCPRITMSSLERHLARIGARRASQGSAA